MCVCVYARLCVRVFACFASVAFNRCLTVRKADYLACIEASFFLASTRAMLTGMMHKYIVPAVSGFFRSITLSDGPTRGNSLQDTLRLLTLWFDYGHLPDVYEALVEGINKIPIDNWLQVRGSLSHFIECNAALSYSR